jgi:hypothetical protein
MSRKRFFILLFFLVSVLIPLSLSAKDKKIVGLIEKVSLCPSNFVIHAKLDTGAELCSLNAPDMEQFRRNGEEWIRFDVTNREGKTITIEKRVVRIAKIKRKGQDDYPRPVIFLGICIADVYKEVEVTLADRRHFQYQMLIGTNYLSGSFIIDPSLNYTVDPKCKGSSSYE